MYPTNNYMDPYYSHFRDHCPYPYYPPPSFPAGNHPMTMDSSCPPPSYGPWPYSGSASHSSLPESHSCCNHTYPPGYYSFRPPFPKELTPPHPYYHGQFPHQPNAYPSYFVPPPPYAVDQTPYSYGKFKSHCCGCPNHVCLGEGKGNLKIEEEMPEVKPETEQKGPYNSSIIRHPNYQYPVMWLPSSNMNDKLIGSSSELPPQLFSKWFPESGEKTDMKREDHDNQKAKQFQWPIIWMPPGYNEPKQEAKQLKEISESPKVTEEAPPSPKIKIIPLSWFENGDHDKKPAAKDGFGDHNERPAAMSKPASTEHRDAMMVDGNFKSIPVVPKKLNDENDHVGQSCEAISVVPDKEGDEKKVRTCRTIPVMPQKEGDEKKFDLGGKKEEKASIVEKEGENRKRNQETSKAKVSKLPPVCLRVDPLPTKKSGNRSSRSSNQATNKVCGKDMDVKEAPTKHKDTKISEPKKESNVSVKEKSTDEMNERIVSRDVTVQDASVKHGLEEQLSTIMAAQKVQPSVNAMAQENAGGNSLQAEIKIQGEAVKLGHEMNLSEVDAAICIQSAYRGYHVRRWQPLQKLRKIKSVHERMQDVKKQLQGLEASSKQQTAKEHIAINETIMNLLLNLDTIQGLHPSVKEARKSVARELTSLQEKLDSLCKQSSAETNQLKSEEEKYAGVEWSSTINSKESMHHDISYVVPMELRKDGDLTEQKHQMEESGTTREQAHDEGKALVPGECQGAPLMDVTSDVVFPGHLAEQKQHIEGANTILMEEWPEEEKAAAEDEGSSAHYIEPLHDSSVSEDSSVLKQLNDGVSPASTEDSTTAAAPTSMESEMVVDKDGSVESLVQEYASVDSSQLKHDVAPANEDQCNEPSTPFVNLEDSSLSSKDAESHGNDPGHADDSIVINQGDQPEEPRVAKMQKQVADPMISANEQDRTPEPTVGDTTVSVENSTQEQIISVEEASKQYEVCCKDETASVDQPNEHHTEKTAGDSDIGEELEAVPFFSKTENVENTLNVADSPNNMCAQPILPEGESSELPCEFDGPRVHEYSGSKVSLESPNDVQKQQSDGEASASEIVECNEMPKGAPVCAAVVNSAVPEADDPKEHPVCATGVNSAVLGTDDLKEDAGGPTISKDVAPVSTTHDGLKKNDEKNLIEENQMLKDMLQKLLASGSNQMGAMAELSEKVKVLEQKLARKKRPKVRVHRPSRNAAANVH
ncbi:BAG family molecular chaperone regulator 6 isoform X2 [Brachypodium distachyon]|uniref:BAG domain-containing protein n=1 Tax=Brachypodium distachyon TaxID=15368 RepID=I1HZC4_BRADI|nr:BAG family molecular chaperone regulator 6 isoform X2 [Brachypodium distachyon]KQJ94303.1 hypothetical protein BRADI_3g09740v3 [Brachypodium distachyon]|eukprot:XP_003572193.2 BAG family molecular chaperone regulator 6 isoform X2 [Brachypodium distachyon]